MFQLSELYSKHLKKQFNYPQYLILLILINLLQNLKTVRLEELARRFPVPIQLRSRVKKIQRFLSMEQFNIKQIWFQLSDLGLTPGMSCYYQGVRVTKTKGFGGFNLAAKWKRNYRRKYSQETWFILTNLNSLSAATDSYAKRMGIEEMFRDFKRGGCNLEITRQARSPTYFSRLIDLFIL